MLPSYRISGRAGRFFAGGVITLLALLAVAPPPGRADSRRVTVGVYENAPKVFLDAAGTPAGIFIDLINDIARARGWDLTYVPGTWGEGLDRLERGDIDLMPDVAYTADRADRFAFHQEQVLSSWFQVYARKGSGIRSILDLAGKRIVVLERSVQAEAFDRLSKGFGLNATLIPLPSYGSLFEEVHRGTADAAVTNRFYGQVNAGKFALEDTAIIFHPTNLYFAAPREGRQALLDAIDAHLAGLKATPQSVYYQSLARWTAQEVAFSLPAWVKIGGWVAGLALLASLAGGVVLKRQVALRTRALTAQNVEMHGINRALRESERKYRELLEHANSIILHWTRDGRITFLNEFGQRFFGYAEAEIVGRNLVGTLVPETGSGGRDMRAMMDRISVDPQAFEQNVNENIRRNGQTVWIAWTNKVYFDDQGRIDGILSIGTDITARREADEALRRLNAELEQRVTERTADLAAAMEKAQAADRIKSAFLATMSHELRTPLNSIIGFTGILLQGLAGPLNAEQQKQMRMVQTSSRHLLALINDVLDISKIEAGQLSLSFAAFELRDAIAKVASLVSPLAARKGIDLRVEIADNVSRVTSDQRRLEQVMLNLLNNAVKFTEKGYVGLACRMEGDDCRLSVSDTGIGIRPEDIPGLFTPFHQVDAGLSRKHEGTGLGLSISQKLMALLGGAIEVHSQWGQGSTFTIRFPRDPGAMPCKRAC